MFRHLRLGLVLLAAVLLPAALFAETDLKENGNLIPPRILMFSPFSTAFVQYFSESNEYLTALNSAGGAYLVDMFSLDTPHKPYPEEKIVRFREVLKRIKSGYYRIVVTFAAPPLELLKDELDTIPPSVTILACGLQTSLANRVPKKGNIVYMFQDLPISENLSLIRKLFPEKKKVILLTHWNKVGQELRAQAQIAIRKFPDLQFIAPDNETMGPKRMLELVDKNSKDAVVIYQGWFSRSAVTASTLQYMMNHLANRADLPLFITHSALLRFGAVGGVMKDSNAYGKVAAQLTLDILEGKQVPKINHVPPKTILNESMLRFYDVPDSRIPADATVFGREKTFFEHYKYQIYIFSCTGGALILIVLLAIFFTFRYRQLATQIRRVFQKLPIRVLAVDPQENVLLYRSSKIKGKITKLNDFSPELYPYLKANLADILKTKQARETEYVLDGRRQRGDFVYLSKEIFGCPAMLGVGIDVDDLYYRTQNERVQNECLRTVLGDFKDTALNSILRILGEYFQGDRCYLVHYNEEKQHAEFVEEYCAKDVKPIMETFAMQHFHTLNDWFKRPQKSKLRVFDLERTRYYGDNRDFWISILRDNHVKRIYTMPIFKKGVLWGCWGLVYKNKDITLTPLQQQIIPSIAQMIELVLRRQAYIKDLSDARDAAQTATRAKSVFLATMSHELRTPLNAVIGFSDLLRDTTPSPQEQREYISGINYSAKNLLSLINDILDFSKLESARMNIVPAPTDLNDILQEFKAVFQQMAMLKGLKLVFNSPEALPIFELDAQRIKQILMNLLSNAVKFTEHGTVALNIFYHAPELKIQVSDTGKGITKDIQATIFEPFVQDTANSSAQRANGTGLGLSIARRLATAMNGSLDLDSKEGSGSTFTLTLRDVRISAVTPESRKQFKPEKLSRTPNILIVDDSRINLKVLSAMLWKNHIPVRQASSGAEALEMLQQAPADIVLTDLRMPGMNGEELAGLIRANPALRHTKVAALTADILFNDEQEKLFDAILLKPITQKALCTTLAKLTE